ncbi:asparaginase [bacterium]|nr:asparaginase [bacterium]
MYPDCYSPIRFVKYKRSELTTQEHIGFVYSSIHSFGETYGYPFFLRSCAKPLQASLIIDENIDFTLEEIALCCASHSGDEYHVDLAKRLLNKIGLKESDLKCGLHKPLSETERERLIRCGEKETVFHNNCVGKHILMLALCLKHGWDIKDYDKIEHPVQQLIKNKIYDLCEVETEDYPETKDGCGVPVFSMPLKNMHDGYLNLFNSTKYEIISKAFLEYPHIIGGKDRLDTVIMQNSENLVAKVGADGLCIVVNLEEAECVVVKMLDIDPKAREITILTILKKLNWADIPCDNKIRTLHGEVVGEMIFDLNL